MSHQSSDKNRGRYTSLTIDGFRLFKHIEFNDLAPINLFFGPNNAGKTSVLEAVFTHACGHNFDPFLQQVIVGRTDGKFTGYSIAEQSLQVFYDKAQLPYEFTIAAKLLRGADYELKHTFEPSSIVASLEPQLLGPSIHSFDSEPSLENGFSMEAQPSTAVQSMVEARGRKQFLGTWRLSLNGKEHKVDFYIPPDEIVHQMPFRQAVMHAIQAHRSRLKGRQIFAVLKRTHVLSEFIQKMGQVFDIVDIDFYPYPDGNTGVIMVTTSNGRRPLHTFGDGMRRWYYLLGCMISYQNSVHCIEEIDAAFHPAAHPKLAHYLVDYARNYKNQLFITSHSLEFLDAFLGSLYAGKSVPITDQQKDPVRVYTLLPSEDGPPTVWSRTGREAYHEREVYDLELRG